MKIMKTNILLSLATILMVGCGGGDSSTSQSTSNNSQKTISGKVADGYLVGAKVCIDKNKDSICNNNEPFSISTAGGIYTIANVTQLDINSYPLLVEVNENVIDEDDNKKVGKAFVLSAPSGETFISPLSTLVQKYMYNNDVNKTAAINKVSYDIGISKSNLLKDYLENNDIDAHNKSKLIVGMKKDLITKIGNNSSLHNKKVIEKYIDDSVLSKLTDIKNNYNSSSFDYKTNLNLVMAQLNTNNISNDLYTASNNLDEIELIDHLGTSYYDLTHSKEIEQNKRYKTTYLGGVDVRNYTIKGASSTKNCRLHILNSTNTFNPYSYTYRINFSDFSPTGKMTLPADNKFSIAWQGYTTENSHLDFFVECSTKPPVQPLAEKYGLNIPTYKTAADTEIFYKNFSVNRFKEYANGGIYYDSNGSITGYNAQNSFTDISWSGISFKANDTVIKTYTNTDSVTPKMIDKYIIFYDKDTKIAKITLFDNQGNTLDTFSKEDIELDSNGKMKLEYFVSKINLSNTTKLIYDSFSLNL